MDTRELKDALSKGRFHKTPDGVIFPDSKILAQGVFRYNIRGQEEESSNNLVVNEGLDYLLGSAISGTSTISNWYIAVFSGDVTVQAAASKFVSQKNLDTSEILDVGYGLQLTAV